MITADYCEPILPMQNICYLASSIWVQRVLKPAMLKPAICQHMHMVNVDIACAAGDAAVWRTLSGKVIRLRQKLVDAADSVKGLFGMKKEQDSAVAQLERVQVG